MQDGLKQTKLENILKEMGSVAVAYSGGTDSSYLVAKARDVLGKDNVWAVTADSETYTRSELRDAIEFVRNRDVNHIIVRTEELKNDDFSSNPVNRCYFCKKELFGKMLEIAAGKKVEWIADGSNTDDIGDFRPGRDAAKEAGVRSPLIEAGLGKEEIRSLSKQEALFTWNKPQAACLASRIPYGVKITGEVLSNLAAAEALLREAGFDEVRVRAHGNVARIEVPRDRIKELAGSLDGQLIEKFKRNGFTYVTVDIEGYRTGSMNEVIAVS